jgi:hypothetical protein
MNLTNMAQKATILTTISIFLLTVAVWQTGLDLTTATNFAMGKPHAGDNVQSAANFEIATVMLEGSGTTSLWYLASFIMISGALYHGFSITDNTWLRIAVACISLYIFYISAEIFFLIDDAVALIEAAHRHISETTLCRFKVADVLVAILSGGFLFEMAKAVFNGDSPSYEHNSP